ncbi:MAG TPA: exonuclease domain-containing protein [Pseudolabrys sp.]|nr:exonuclease domain-containing protein [Pseudolabrys sp.]
MTYIFYDTETTGKLTAFDQILQFAAIKTDAELNVIETFNIRCRLLPYVVPSPGALLVTGATIADITSCPLSHFEMMRQIHAKMHRWSEGGATFVGWNSMKFDETLLRQAYYQTLLPVYQTNTNGNGRADMMRMAQVVAACTPNILAVPLTAEGKRTFKLVLMAAANNVALENAHDALADTSATLGIARLIKQRTPAMWDILIANARKNAPLKLLQSDPFMLLSEYFGNPFNYIVAPIAANSGNANEWALFDLQFDPVPYLDAGDAELSEAIDGTTKVIRRVSINAQPGLLPIDYAPDEVRGGRQSLETYQARAQSIRGHAEFRRRISRLLAARYEDKIEPAYVEQRIYGGFPSNADQTRMHVFHGQGWEDRIGNIREIEDERSRQIGQRLIAVERPDLLTDAQRQQWDSWRRERFLTTEKVPWMTVASALEELVEKREEATSAQQVQLADLQRFLNNLGR